MDPPPSCCGPVSAAPSGKGSRCGTKAPEREVWGRRWGCVQASECRPRRPDARLRQGFTFVYRQEQHGKVRAMEFTDRC